MGDVIDIHTKRIEDIDELALLTVFYFNEEYGEEVRDLNLEVRYAMVIMTYKFLSAARADNTLQINDKGFTIDSTVKKKLNDCIQAAISSYPITMN